MSVKTVKLNFLFGVRGLGGLRDLVPAGKRSKVVNAAVKKELLRIKRQAATDKLLEIRQKGPDVAMAEIVEALRADRSGH